MRASFALIFLLAAASFKLGFHSIIGAFIGGLLVSEILPRVTLQEEKLQSFGYSFFITMFFIFIGSRVNIVPVFSNLDNVIVFLVLIAVGIISKIAGVAFASRLSGLKLRESLAIGLFHRARLSLVLAAVDISLKISLINEALFAMFVLRAIVSAILAPSIGRNILVKNK